MLGHSLHNLKPGSASGRSRLPHLRVTLCTIRLCAALAFAALAGTAALAKEPQIIVSDTIRVVQGGEAELVVNVEPGDAQLDGAWVVISSVDIPFVLSQGSGAAGTWVLDFAELKGLKIRLPEAGSGRSKLLLLLFGKQGGVQDAAEITLIVEPALAAADAVTTPSVPKAAETIVAPAAVTAVAASSPPSTLAAQTSPQGPPAAAAVPSAASAIAAPDPVKIEPPAPKVELAPLVVAEPQPAPVTATPQLVVTPPRVADTPAPPTSAASSPSPPQVAPTPVAVVTGPAAVAPPEASVELKAQWQRLIGLGQRQLAQGNISYARQYFLRAADTGSATAALRLAETYDGEQLRRLKVIGVTADAGQARHWYKRAGQLGADEAADKLQHLKLP